MAPSPEQKKMKKAALSQSVGGALARRKAILNRQSSGKKAVRSEPRIVKGAKTSIPRDLVKRLAFQEDEDEGMDKEEEEEGALMSSKAKKAKAARKALKSATSKWEVTVAEAKPVSPKEDSKKPAAGNKPSTSNELMASVDDSDDDDDDDDSEDAEIDFPVLKRNSVGGKEAAKLALKDTKSVAPSGHKNGTVKESKKGKKIKAESRKELVADKGTNEKGQGDKKKKRRRRKRKRSTSESEEPEAKKGKQANFAFAVRCGNLPVGTSKSALRMFFGEADVMPTKIILRSKKKSGTGEKKQFVKYATIACQTAEEADRLCNLNGISMPSSSGQSERKLLIHKMGQDSGEDVTFKRKLFIRSLHPRTTEEEMMDFFTEGGLHPTNAIIPRKGTSKLSRGYGFMWLSSAGDVDKALKLKKPTLRGQPIVLARSRRAPSVQEEP